MYVLYIKLKIQSLKFNHTASYCGSYLSAWRPACLWWERPVMSDDDKGSNFSKYSRLQKMGVYGFFFVSIQQGKRPIIFF